MNDLLSAQDQLTLFVVLGAWLLAMTDKENPSVSKYIILLIAMLGTGMLGMADYIQNGLTVGLAPYIIGIGLAGAGGLMVMLLEIKKLAQEPIREED